MKSIFDPSFQNQDLESKIVVALERVSQVFRINLWKENKKHNLSPIQMQILIFLNFQIDDRKTVSQLAQEFNMTKATISTAVSVLATKSYLSKKTNPADSRSFILQLTEKGRQATEGFSLFANELREHISEMGTDKKEGMLKTLLQLINKLQRHGIISQQRMCFSCLHFAKNPDSEYPYYCKLLARPLKESDLRIDCLEHAAMN